MTHDVEKEEEMDSVRLGLGLQSAPSSYVFLFFNICVSAWPLKCFYTRFSLFCGSNFLLVHRLSFLIFFLLMHISTSALQTPTLNCDR